MLDILAESADYLEGYQDALNAVSGGGTTVSVATILIVVGMWFMFKKAGKPGWAAVVPIYNVIVLMQVCGYRGLSILRYFIPIYNIYWIFHIEFELARRFGAGVGFGLLNVFFPEISYMILGLADKYTYHKKK